MKAKANYWHSAAVMDMVGMESAASTLKSDSMKKYSSLTASFTTALDAINADQVRLTVNERVYRGYAAAEDILDTQYDQLDRDIEKAKKAGIGSYVLTDKDLSTLNSKMETLYDQKEKLWDIKASGSSSPAVPSLEASVNKQLAEVQKLYDKLNACTGGDHFTLPAFSMDTANQKVLEIRQQLRAAVYDADPDKAWDLYDRALGFLDQGATLDIDELEPNLANTDWSKLRIDKMFRDTIEQLNREALPGYVEAMQKALTTMNFYNGPIDGKYNKDFLIAVGMYQNILSNSPHFKMWGFEMKVDGKIDRRLLETAMKDAEAGRTAYWADRPEQLKLFSFNEAFVAVGVADGFISQLVGDANDLSKTLILFNPLTPLYYTQTLPSMYATAKAIASGEIKWEDVKAGLSDTLAAQFITPFKEIKENYNAIQAGNVNYEQARAYGRNVALAVEAISIAVGILGKSAQLAGKLAKAEASLVTATGNAAAGSNAWSWVGRVTKDYAEKLTASLERRFGKPQAEQFDFKSWEEMPVSGQIRIASNGQRLMSVREIKTFKREMSAINVKVIIDKNDSILPSNVAAGFNPETGQIVLRREPTYLSALHESYHAKQWRQMGKENYLKQSILEREEYVYNEIMRNKDKFSEAEILFSQRYIFKLRNGNWPPQDWKGFEE